MILALPAGRRPCAAQARRAPARTAAREPPRLDPDDGGGAVARRARRRRTAGRAARQRQPEHVVLHRQARARGFLLDGYGVFFHVEIPEMQQSLVLSVTTVERDLAVASALEALRSALGAVPEGALKLQAEGHLKRLELQVGRSADPAAVATGDCAGRQRDALSAADNRAGTLPSCAIRAVLPGRDQGRLIDAMLEHSRGMNIRPDEWLTRGGASRRQPSGPNEIVTRSTLVLRIKGSDLAIYDADRTQQDEIRKRVEAREF